MHEVVAAGAQTAASFEPRARVSTWILGAAKGKNVDVDSLGAEESSLLLDEHAGPRMVGARPLAGDHQHAQAAHRIEAGHSRTGGRQDSGTRRGAVRRERAGVAPAPARTTSRRIVPDFEIVPRAADATR